MKLQLSVADPLVVNMKSILLACLAAFALMGSATSLAQSGADKNRSPFSEYPLVAPEVFAYERELFTQYKGPSVSRLKVQEFEERRRLGIVAVAPKISAYVDRIDNTVHGPSFLEVTDLKAGTLLGRFDLGLGAGPAELLFSGHGNVYLHHVPTSVCFGSATRKFVLVGKRLVETHQAITYLNAEADVYGDIKVLAAPDNSAPVVASLQEGTRVLVLGIAPDSVALGPNRDQALPTLLIRTPLGLTGWYVPSRSGSERGGLSITTCN
ncbi:MAG: hypothetical protein E6Q78_11140 [Rhodoferax sp.]|nr:MAG: hypothetical protein E6Q78_11140 [Rhodoferax sp.]